MAWTLAQLTTAITALGAPVGTPDAAIATLINAQTTTGSIPTLFATTGAAIMTCLNWAEFATLPATQQTQILAVGALATVQGGSASFVGGMFVAFYATKLAGPTIAALTALAQAAVIPTWSPAVDAKNVFDARGGV